MQGVRELISADAIATRVRELAGQIDALALPHLHLVGVLTGAYVFVADLSRALKTPHTIDFIAVSSYGAATESSGVVRMERDLSRPVAGRNVLLVEDIVDTGLTVRFLIDELKARGAADVHTAALLSKPARRRTAVPVDFVGFTIPDAFVVGYGLDHDQRWRHLPYVAVVESSAGDGERGPA